MCVCVLSQKGERHIGGKRGNGVRGGKRVNRITNSYPTAALVKDTARDTRVARVPQDLIVATAGALGNVGLRWDTLGEGGGVCSLGRGARSHQKHRGVGPRPGGAGVGKVSALFTPPPRTEGIFGLHLKLCKGTECLHGAAVESKGAEEEVRSNRSSRGLWRRETVKSHIRRSSPWTQERETQERGSNYVH